MSKVSVFEAFFQKSNLLSSIKIKVLPVHKWATYICSTESVSEISKQYSSEII